MNKLSYVVDTKKVSGKPMVIYRHFYFFNDVKDYFSRAHKYFTKDEKKAAKLQHKLDMKKEKKAANER